MAVWEVGISPVARCSVVGEVDVRDNLLAKLDDESHAGTSRKNNAREACARRAFEDWVKKKPAWLRALDWIIYLFIYANECLSLRSSLQGLVLVSTLLLFFTPTLFEERRALAPADSVNRITLTPDFFGETTSWRSKLLLSLLVIVLSYKFREAGTAVNNTLLQSASIEEILHLAV